MPKKKQSWGRGDIFLIPLLDGTLAVCQVVEPAKDAMNSVVCVFSSHRVSDVDKFLSSVVPSPASAISVLFVTRDLLDSGRWKIVSNIPNDWAARLIDFDHLSRTGFVGAKIVGSANVETLLNAFHGLRSWGGFHNPDYLNKLLLTPQKRATLLL